MATLSILWVIGAYVLTFSKLADCATWAEWWTYDRTSLSGPENWGKVNAEWSICLKGNKQSPINIRTKDLLYDPNLRRFHVSRHRVNASMQNNGHFVHITIDSSSKHLVNISGGPLQYHYHVSDIVIHFGETNSEGSEHSIDGRFHSGEIQIIGWNSDIYSNATEALGSSNGLAVIALLMKVAEPINIEFDVISNFFSRVKYKGQKEHIRGLSIAELLPASSEFMTYEGSLTYPGCQETVTWIIPNQPFHVSQKDLDFLRELKIGTSDKVIQPMVNNIRPVNPLNHRTVRTNINFRNVSSGCTMEATTFYEVNF
uniref:Carbonic anhydrase n=1 Tax=Hydroides elegans TaxID=216498 RepID=A0A191ZDM3_HYDEL|nr:carbonic anhydrase [Hydroides elegans]